MHARIRIGTRKSQLALWQANWLKTELEEKHPGLKAELIEFHTTGDKITDVALAQIGGQGLFTKELELALLEDKADLAVHSLKDLPTVLPDGLGIYAYSPREDPRDALLSLKGYKIDDLPAGAVVGTSSLRRRAQLLAYRPDLKVKDLRGNLNTRLEKLRHGGFEAIILAAAGVKRLGLEEYVTQFISPDTLLPAVGQGIIAVEARETSVWVRDLLKPVNDLNSLLAAEAERSFMQTVEGGCQVPMGALARVLGDELNLQGFVASLDGQKVLRAEVLGATAKARELGVKLGQNLLQAGAEQILQQVRQETEVF